MDKRVGQAQGRLKRVGQAQGRLKRVGEITHCCFFNYGNTSTTVVPRLSCGQQLGLVPEDTKLSH